MNVLLTGATGFLGSHLLSALLSYGHCVTILKRSTSNTWRIDNLQGQFECYDIDNGSIEGAFSRKKFDAVFHTACNYGRNAEPMNEIIASNLIFGLRVLEAAIKFNTQTFFNADTFFNTDTVISKYLNTYSLAKKQFLEWLKQYSNQIQIVNLRLQHLYGPGDDKSKFVPWLLDQFNHGVDEIPLSKGNQLRDFVYIDDVISAYLHLLSKKQILCNFNEFDVGSGNLITVKNFVEKFHATYRNINKNCNTHLNFGAIPCRDGELMTVKVDTSRLNEIGWYATVNLEKGIEYLIRA